MDSMNNTTNLDDVSLQILGQQFGSHLLWAVFTPVVIIANSLVIATIFGTKSLHNKSQFIIVSHSAVEILYALIYLVIGVKRCLSCVLSIPETTTEFLCLLKQLPPFTGGNLVKSLTLATAFDRFLCINAPIFYATRRNAAYIVTLNAVCWGFSLGKIPFTFIGYDTHRLVPFCTSSVPFKRELLFYWGMEGYVMVSCTAALNSIGAAVMLYRYKTAKFVGQNAKSEWRRKMDWDVFKAMSAIGIAYALTFGASGIIGAVGAQLKVSFDTSTKLTRANQVLVLCNATSHIIFFTWLNPSFRGALSVMMRGARYRCVRIVSTAMAYQRGMTCCL